MDDAVLLRRFASDRDDDAFTEILRRHAGLVHSVCRRVAGPALAEDAFQSTFFALSRRAAVLTGHPTIAGWLHQAAMRISRGLRRQAMRRHAREARMASDRSAAQSGGQHHPDSGQEDELDAAIDGLPERYRVPVVLHYLEGMTLAEMSLRLSLSEDALAQRLFRARRKLQQALKRPSERALGQVAGAGLCPAAACARAQDWASHPGAVPAHLARAAHYVSASWSPALALALVGVAVAILSLGAMWMAHASLTQSWRGSPGASAPAAIHLPAAHAAHAASPPQDPEPGTAAWATNEAWDTQTKNDFPVDTRWLAEGVRPAVAVAHAPNEVWARIGSVEAGPAGDDWSPARDRPEGWDAGVPRVGPGAALWGPADGAGLDGARPGRRCCIFISEIGAGEDVIAPLHLRRSGHDVVLALDRWDDLPAARPLRRHVMLVDLGTLEAGRTTVWLVVRHFTTSQGINDYWWADTAFASAAVDVGASSVPTIVHRGDFKPANGMGIVRAERTPRLERAALIPWSPGDGGVTEPLTTWSGFKPIAEAMQLIARPRLPPEMGSSSLAGLAQPALVVIGPAMPSGGHLWITDQMSLASDPGFRAQWWLSFDEGGEPARRIIVVPLPARDPRTPAPTHDFCDWEACALGADGACSHLAGYGGGTDPGWRSCYLTDEMKQVIRQQLQARKGSEAARSF